MASVEDLLLAGLKAQERFVLQDAEIDAAWRDGKLNAYIERMIDEEMGHHDSDGTTGEVGTRPDAGPAGMAAGGSGGIAQPTGSDTAGA